MNLEFNDIHYPSLSEFITEERDKKDSLYGKRMDYAHNVDSKIIKALQSTHVQRAMNKLAESLTTINCGIDLSTGIVIDSFNFPELDEILNHCCKTLGVLRPHAVVTSNLPGINAYATGTVDHPYLVVSSIATHLMTKEELTFIIGHECGHLAMEHLVYHLIGGQLAQLGTMIPVLGPMLVNVVQFPLNTWERYSEITADRAGFLCCGDLRVAQRALLKLESAFANVEHVDIDAYIAQSLESIQSMKAGTAKEYFMNHPLTPKRLKALQLFQDSELFYRVTSQQPPHDAKLLPDSYLNQKIDELLTVL